MSATASGSKDFPQNPYRGFAPWTPLGTSVLQIA